MEKIPTSRIPINDEDVDVTDYCLQKHPLSIGTTPSNPHPLCVELELLHDTWMAEIIYRNERLKSLAQGYGPTLGQPVLLV